LLDADGWMLLTAHSSGWDDERLGGALSDTFADAAELATGTLDLVAESGAVLALGAFARVMITR
jgi:hypothetical protein